MDVFILYRGREASLRFAWAWAWMNDALKGYDEVGITFVPGLAGLANERIYVVKLYVFGVRRCLDSEPSTHTHTHRAGRDHHVPCPLPCPTPLIPTAMAMIVRRQMITQRIVRPTVHVLLSFDSSPTSHRIAPHQSIRLRQVQSNTDGPIRFRCFLLLVLQTNVPPMRLCTYTSAPLRPSDGTGRSPDLLSPLADAYCPPTSNSL